MQNYGKGGLIGLGMLLTLGAAAPAWAEAGGTAKDQTLELGVLFYGDYNYYSKTGLAPQFLTQQIHPATGSNYDSFEVTRTYLDFKYTPVPGWSLRVTPNLNRDPSGNLYVRIKYAYLDKKGLFDGVDAIKDDVVTGGQEPNPLIGWEEDMWGYRFVNLVPWNYVGLSSTYDGVSLHGPIRFNGLQYIDYDVGVFNNASFHAVEATKAKQVMARVSYYPLGASSRFAGLGLTAFIDEGSTSSHHNLSRSAFLVHYNASAWGLAGEYDSGRNAVGAGNLYSGQTNGFSADMVGDPNFAADSAAIGGQLGSRQSGYAAFGHYNLPAGWSVFGMYQHFEPNKDTKALNFDRYTAGVAYSPNAYLAFALDYQDFHWSEKGKLQNAGVSSNGLSDTQVVFLNVQFKDSHAFHL